MFFSKKNIKKKKKRVGLPISGGVTICSQIGRRQEGSWCRTPNFVQPPLLERNIKKFVTYFPGFWRKNTVFFSLIFLWYFRIYYIIYIGKKFWIIKEKSKKIFAEKWVLTIHSCHHLIRNSDVLIVRVFEFRRRRDFFSYLLQKRSESFEKYRKIT